MSDEVRVDLAETHISTVLFWGDRAFKIKKPVKTAFLDFSTRPKRLAACKREVELNRRMAPDVYLGVADVLGPDGQPCEHLVVMRRMPPERRLSNLVGSGAGLTDEIEKIARTIADFHSRAVTSPAIGQAGTPAAIEARWRANLTELERSVGEVLAPHLYEQVAKLSCDYVGGREVLFGERIAAGAIRDCHGDLLTDDIFCLGDGPRILDCIEFDDSFRYIDVLDDVATLVMDLQSLGASSTAADLAAFYTEFSGECHPPSLLAHYIAYRALVRTKVACIRYEQGHEASKQRAVQLFDLCADRLGDAEIRLVLVGGLPGTGKSTLARALGDEMGWPVLRSDEIRHELTRGTAIAIGEAGFEQGAYAPEFTLQTYRTLLDRARESLQRGFSVILDASWSRADLRRGAAELAAATKSRLVQIECRLAPAVASERIRDRARAGGDASEATPAIAALMVSRFEPWPDAISMDTELPVSRLVEEVKPGLSSL